MNQSIDIAIIIAYLLAIVSLGVWVGLRGRKKGPDVANNDFLASGRLKWPVIGLAFFQQISPPSIWWLSRRRDT